MPKLTKEELKEVRYISMADYSRRVDELEDFDDKLAFTTRYLLTHGMYSSKEYDYSFEAAVHLARTKIADEAVKLRDKLFEESEESLDNKPNVVNPYARPGHDKAAELFMGNPAEYLKGEAKKLEAEIEAQEHKIGIDDNVSRNCARLQHELGPTFTQNVFALEMDSTAIDVKARLENHFGGREELEKAYKSTKPGFFSRVMGTSSVASSNLDEVYQAFNNRNHVLYGNMDALERAANDYLIHKFPGWEPGEPLPLDQAKLNKNEKAKVDFSSQILKSVQEQRNMEEYFQELTYACKGQNLTYSDTVEAQASEDLMDEIAKADKENALESKEELDLSDELKEDESMYAIGDENPEEEAIVRAARAAEVADQFSFQKEVSELVEDSDVDFHLNDTLIDDDDSLEDSKLIDDNELSA